MKKLLCVLVTLMLLSIAALSLAEEAAAYTEYEIWLQGADYEIPATVCLPAGDGVYPAVVMLHGTGTYRDDAGNAFLYCAHAMAESGVASIRFDFPGNGESKADYTQYTFDSAVADALTCANYMISLDNVSDTQVGVMGWSQGGTDALLCAGRNPEFFKSVVTWAGAPSMLIDGYFSMDDYEEAKQNGYFVMEFDWRENLNVSLQWAEDVVNTDVLDVFSAYEGPVLAIAGTADTTVDPEWSNKIVAANTNEASKTYFIEGMDHTFNVFTGDLTNLNKAIDATAAFFADTLK